MKNYHAEAQRSQMSESEILCAFAPLRENSSEPASAGLLNLAPRFSVGCAAPEKILLAGFSRLLIPALTIIAVQVSAFAQPLDPAAWGSDHIGQPLSNFTSGDECLFCHRDVGPGWPTNRHGQTIRAVNTDSPQL